MMRADGAVVFLTWFHSSLSYTHTEPCATTVGVVTLVALVAVSKEAATKPASQPQNTH
jgi:hypothetical protein